MAGLYGIIVFMALCAGVELNTVTVETNVGTIKGSVEDIHIFDEVYKIETFLGIPYAEAPVGERRFQKPLPKAPFSSPFSAFTYGNACYAINIVPPFKKQSEDCLFLDVFVPVKQADKPDKLPVMICIHGGAFIFGSSNACLHEKLTSFGEVILVTINYRLAVFGFYSTEDDSAPGNYGLWDQHLAIKWVHDNIQGFSGDPDRVTIFGESSGSASGMLQSFYSGNQGLFHRVIGQSGSITSSWAFHQKSRKTAKKLGNLLGCNVSNTSIMTECIRYVSASRIDSVLNDLSNDFFAFPFPLGPTIDGEFVRESPWKLLNSHSLTSSEDKEFFSSLEIIIGQTEYYGAGCLSPLTGIPDDENFDATRSLFRDVFIPNMISPMFKKIPEDLESGVLLHYFKSATSDQVEMKKIYAFFATDVAFTISTLDTLSLHSQLSAKNRYLYNFHPIPTHRFLPTPSWVDGANHADDLFFTSGFPEDISERYWGTKSDAYNPMDWEIQLSKAMMTAWTNFAKTGDPNLPTSLKPYLNTDWPVYNLQTERYLNFTREMTSEAGNGDHFHSDRMEFWYKQLPAIIKAQGREDSKTASCSKDGDCIP